MLASAMCATYQLIVGNGCGWPCFAGPTLDVGRFYVILFCKSFSWCGKVVYDFVLQILFSIWKGCIWPCFACPVLDVERFHMTLFCRSFLDVERLYMTSFSDPVLYMERLYMTLFCRSCSRCEKVSYDLVLQVLSRCGKVSYDLVLQILFSMGKGWIWPCCAGPVLDVAAPGAAWGLPEVRLEGDGLCDKDRGSQAGFHSETGKIIRLLWFRIYLEIMSN